MSKPLIKSVFCSYRGVLVVHDIHGNRVGDLCGEMTLEKYNEIEERVADITEFDGLDNYKRIAAELEEQLVIPDISDIGPIVPVSNPLGIPVSNTIDIQIENTTNQKIPVVLFGAHHHYKSTCFGNDPGIIVSSNYKSVLAQTMAQPLVVKSILFDDCSKIIGGTFEIKKTNATGGTKTSSVIISNYVSASQLGSTVAVNVGQIVIDGSTEINFELKEKSSLRIKLF